MYKNDQSTALFSTGQNTQLTIDDLSLPKTNAPDSILNQKVDCDTINKSNTSQVDAKFRPREPIFPNRPKQPLVETKPPTTKTFYAVRSDELARRVRTKETPHTQDGEDKRAVPSTELNDEAKDIAHKLATKTVHFADESFSYANTPTTSHMHEMNTMTLAQDIASFHVVNGSKETITTVSELDFEMLQPKECNIILKQVDIISEESVQTTTIPVESVLFTTEVQELQFNTVEQQPSDFTIENCEPLFSEARVSCAPLIEAKTIAKITAKDTQPQPRTGKKKRTLTSKLQQSYSQLKQRIAKVFHKPRVHPVTIANSFPRNVSRFVSEHSCVSNNTEIDCVSDISQHSYESRNDTILKANTAFVYTHEKAHNTVANPISKCLFLQEDVKYAKVSDLDHELKNCLIDNTNTEVLRADDSEFLTAKQDLDIKCDVDDKSVHFSVVHEKQSDVYPAQNVSISNNQYARDRQTEETKPNGEHSSHLATHVFESAKGDTNEQQDKEPPDKNTMLNTVLEANTFGLSSLSRDFGTDLWPRNINKPNTDAQNLYAQSCLHSVQTHDILKQRKSNMSDTKPVFSHDFQAPSPSTAPTEHALINEHFIPLLVRDTIPITADVTNVSIPGNIYGHDMSFLIDTGASVSAIKTTVKDQISQLASLTPTATSISSIKSVSGDVIAVQGLINLPFTIGHNSYPFTALVIDKMAYDAILGRDFLDYYKAKIDLENHILTLGTDSLPFSSDYDSSADSTTNIPTCFVQAQSSFIIPPSTEIIAPAVLEHPAAKGTTGIIEPRQEFMERYQLAGAAELVNVWDNNSVPIRLLNPTNQPIQIYRKTRLGQISFVDNEIATFNLHKSDLQAEASREVPTAVDCDPPAPFDIHTDGLTQDQQNQIQALLTKYKDVFAYTADQLGRCSIVKHTIDTGDNAPIRLRPYRTTPANKEEIDKQINEMLKNDVISPSTSPWASPVVLVKKSDGNMRFCIDYRKLNQITEKDSHPLPRITEALDALGGARHFSTLDLRSGYWQVEMDADSKEKTAFITHNGLFEFNVLPFGLCNSAGTFQRLMTHVLRGLEWDICLVYIDDLIIFSRTFDEHLLHLEQVLKRLREANVRLKPNKCHFVKPEVEYSGHIVSAEGLRPNPSKIRAVTEFPVPTNTTGVKAFLGICNYYRRFIKGFATIASPLNKLTSNTSLSTVFRNA